MTRKLHKLTESDTYKPSHGWHGFSITDNAHRTVNSFVDNARLHFGVLGSVNKTNGQPWLELKTVETTFDKNGKARSHESYLTMKRDEMIALRDTINAVLGDQS